MVEMLGGPARDTDLLVDKQMCNTRLICYRFAIDSRAAAS
jgi:hypothetical protein